MRKTIEKGEVSVFLIIDSLEEKIEELIEVNPSLTRIYRRRLHDLRR